MAGNSFERMAAKGLASMDQLAEELKAGTVPPEKVERIRETLIGNLRTASQLELALYLAVYQGATEACLQMLAGGKLQAENKRLRHALADAAQKAGEYAHWAREKIDRLERIEAAASHYRFAGADGSEAFLKKRGWTPHTTAGLWFPPAGYPIEAPKSVIVSLAVELEMSLGLHK